MQTYSNILLNKFTALSFKIALHSQRLCYFIVGRCPDGQNYIFDY